ncbi:hypothetical protein K1719_045995 [Acacia pycnantha]|nr:hypothetical protein K1719_045995 [Acacia pycnantha]
MNPMEVVVDSGMKNNRDGRNESFIVIAIGLRDKLCGMFQQLKFLLRLNLEEMEFMQLEKGCTCPVCRITPPPFQLFPQPPLCCPSDFVGAAPHRPILCLDHTHVIDDIAAALSHDSANLNMASSDNPNAKSEVGVEDARSKAEILAHLLYEQLLSAHMACLRIATPVDQLPRIDGQLAQSQNVVAKYSTLGHGAHSMVVDEKGLDLFMVSSRILCYLLVKNSTLFICEV